MLLHRAWALVILGLVFLTGTLSTTANGLKTSRPYSPARGPITFGLESASAAGLAVDVAVTNRVDPNVEFEATCTITNSSLATITAVGLQLRRIPGLEVVSVGAGTLDSACCSNHVINLVAPVLLAGDSTNVVIRLRATTPGIWPVDVRAFNDSNDATETGDERFVYANPPGGSPGETGFALPFQHVEWSSARFEWIAWSGRSLVRLSPFNLSLQGVAAFPQALSDIQVTDDGNYVWAVLRGGDVARLTLATGLVELHFPVPLLLGPGAGTIRAIPFASGAVVAFGPDTMGLPRVIVYDGNTSRPSEYATGLVAVPEAYRLAVSTDYKVYVALGSQLRELQLDPLGVSLLRDLDAQGFSSDSLVASHGLLFRGKTEALDLVTLHPVPTGSLSAISLEGTGLGSDTIAGGSQLVRDFDVVRRVTLWRKTVASTNSLNLVAGSFFGNMNLGPNGGIISSPLNSGVDLGISESVTNHTATINDLITVPLTITRSGAWAAVNSRLIADFSDGLAAVDPASTSNHWVLPLGHIDETVQVAVQFRVTKLGGLAMTFRVESDFLDLVPENDAAVVNLNPPVNHLLMEDQVVFDDGHPLRLNLALPAAFDFDVKFTVELLTASLDDVLATNVTAHFFQGNTSAEIALVAPDTQLEPAEQLRLIFVSGPVEPTAPSALITIANDDHDPLELTAASVAVAEGNDGVTTAEVTLILSQASPVPVTIGFRTVDGTATAGFDFNPTNGVVVFAPGEQTNVVRVRILGDTVFEKDETLTLDFTVPAGVAAPATATVITILNDDTIGLLAESRTYPEGDSGTNVVQFPVALNAVAETAIEVAYSIHAGTATAGVDYIATSGVLVFAPGQTTSSIAIGIVGDRTLEPDETLTIEFSGGSQVILPAVNPTITIQNDDRAVVLAPNRSYPEGNTGTNIFQYPVVLEFASDIPVEVHYNLNASTATLDVDFVSASGVLVFTPGQTTNYISIGIIGDLEKETDETFTIDLTATAQVALPPGGTVITILNDDSIGLLAESRAYPEGDSGTNVVQFPVALNAVSETAIEVAYSIHAGTATAGVDYIATSGVLVFAPGQTTSSIAIGIVGDRALEPDETLTVEFSSGSQVILPAVNPTITIRNDDRAVVLAPNRSYPEGNTGTNIFQYPVVLEFASDIPVEVHYNLNASTAALDVDFVSASGVLVFTPGQTTNYISIGIIGDLEKETDETFTIDLTATEQVALPPGGTVITILDNDAPGGTDLRVTLNGAGVVAVEFDSRLGSSYQLERRSDLTTGDWTDLGDVLKGTGGVISVQPGSRGKESYFRLKTL